MPGEDELKKPAGDQTRKILESIPVREPTPRPLPETTTPAPDPLRQALEEIVELRSQAVSDLTRAAMARALKSFAAELEKSQADIPGDILEPLGPEDRRATLLAFCNLVAVGYFGRPQPVKPKGLIIIPGRTG